MPNLFDKAGNLCYFSIQYIVTNCTKTLLYPVLFVIACVVFYLIVIGRRAQVVPSTVALDGAAETRHVAPVEAVVAPLHVQRHRVSQVVHEQAGRVLHVVPRHVLVLVLVHGRRAPDVVAVREDQRRLHRCEGSRFKFLEL